MRERGAGKGAAGEASAGKNRAKVKKGKKPLTPLAFGESPSPSRGEGMGQALTPLASGESPSPSRGEGKGRKRKAGPLTPLAFGESPSPSRGEGVPREGFVLGGSKNGVQKRIGRPSDWTPAMAAKFVAVLAESCNVSLAARAIRRSIGNVYIQRTKDAAFRAAWEQALCVGYAKLEVMTLERALNGSERVVTQKSGETRIIREYNDRVALALLRHHREAVAQIESAIDEEEYSEACERIVAKLAKLRERGGDGANGAGDGKDGKGAAGRG